jgi:hypothetical protein
MSQKSIRVQEPIRLEERRLAVSIRVDSVVVIVESRHPMHPMHPMSVILTKYGIKQLEWVSERKA